MANGVAAFQSRAYRIIYRVEYRLFVDKAHLDFRRMYVGIDRFGRKLDKQHASRKTPHHNHALVRALQGYQTGLCLDVAIVDKEMLHGTIGTGTFRFADEATNLYPTHGIFHGNQRSSKRLAQHGVDTRKHLTIAGRLELGTTVANEFNRNLRMR